METETESNKNDLLQELSGVIRKLQEASEDVQMFLRYIYKAHPPKKPEHKLDETLLKTDQIKKAIKTAIRHYHPDKLSKDLGRKWLLLSEEITKCLTNMYRLYK